MRIVVTGALGHIGSRLIRELAVALPGAEIVMVDNLATERYASLYDLSWLRDVIPLPDPPAGTTTLHSRHVRGNHATGMDDWTISYQG